MDKEKSINQQMRGEEAKRVLENPLVVNAFAEIEAEYIRIWRTSQIEDGGIREKSYLSLVALDDFKQKFSQIVIQGKAAEKLLANTKESN